MATIKAKKQPGRKGTKSAPPPLKRLVWAACPEAQVNVLSGLMKMNFSGITNVVVAFVHLRWDTEIQGADVTVWNTPVDILLRVGNLDVRLNVHGNYCQVQ